MNKFQISKIKLQKNLKIQISTLKIAHDLLDFGACDLSGIRNLRFGI
jgi:hypothetical protein